MTSERAVRKSTRDQTLRRRGVEGGLEGDGSFQVFEDLALRWEPKLTRPVEFQLETEVSQHFFSLFSKFFPSKLTPLLLFGRFFQERGKLKENMLQKKFFSQGRNEERAPKARPLPLTTQHPEVRESH